MRLLKLSLQNWRGVAACEVAFSNGVTLIEGPNEIGKSTIVEAVRMLFNELDSSKKQAVKAIKPVDQDIGSRVEVEVESGHYHFIYTKTFNKTAQTSLHILAPGKSQLTGREAHEAVEKILAETVDMALWEALLVDQGEKVALANLHDSAGLAKALDEAAGSAAAGNDDSGLFQVARNEYERYYTLKTGKPRFSGLETAYDQAVIALEAAQQALAEVETTSSSHDRSTAEVLRIKAELPGLQEKVNEYEKTWQTVSSLQDKVTAKDQELAAALAIQQAALNAHKARLDLLEDLRTGQLKVAAATREQAPLQEQVERLKEQSGNAQTAIAELRNKVKSARNILDLADADERYVQSLATLAREQSRQQQLAEISGSRKASVRTLASIRINDEALETLRAAEARLAIASATRNAAATSILVTAEDELTIDLDGEEVSLAESQSATRSVAAQLRLRLPGIATIDISPSQSVAELQGEVDDAGAALTQLLLQFGVKDLKEAVTANEKRADAQRNVDRLKTREEEILRGVSSEEIKQSIASTQAECDKYIGQRQSRYKLPETPAEAGKRVAAARAGLADREAAFESAQEQAEKLRAEHATLDSQLRIAQQTLAGFAAALTDKETQLHKLRAATPDSELEEQAAAAAAAVRTLQTEADALRARLDRSSPDSAKTLLKNSRGVYERANADLINEQQNLAVLTDRLQQAQADGRFEAMENAERNLEETSRALQQTRRRAQAAELLWNTLNEHRDATRQAYVKPLKEAIERLGTIVFGEGFEVEIGEDWSVLTRTLHGKTLPFDYLSIGAKEQLGILARLAAARIVATQGGVPLIIDDALGFSDPSRLQTTGAAIAAAGEDCQIIILTCTPGRFTHVGSAKLVRL